MSTIDEFELWNATQSDNNKIKHRVTKFFKQVPNLKFDRQTNIQQAAKMSIVHDISTNKRLEIQLPTVISPTGLVKAIVPGSKDPSYFFRIILDTKNPDHKLFMDTFEKTFDKIYDEILSDKKFFGVKDRVKDKNDLIEDDFYKYPIKITSRKDKEKDVTIIKEGETTYVMFIGLVHGIDKTTNQTYHTKLYYPGVNKKGNQNELNWDETIYSKCPADLLDPDFAATNSLRECSMELIPKLYVKHIFNGSKKSVKILCDSIVVTRIFKSKNTFVKQADTINEIVSKFEMSTEMAEYLKETTNNVIVTNVINVVDTYANTSVIPNTSVNASVIPTTYTQNDVSLFDD